MKNFWQLLENADLPLEEDEELRNLIKKGLESHPERKDGRTFWDDFLIILTANPDATAKLLDIKRDTIVKWFTKINKLQKSVKKELTSYEKKNKMLPTGD